MIVSGVVLAGLFGGGLLLWLLLLLIRARSGSNGGASPRRTAALLGGMFGFPAGMWIYDKLYPYSDKTPVSRDAQRSAVYVSQNDKRRG